MINELPVNDNTTYIICECATRPEDVSMQILQENTITNPANGQKIFVVTIETTLQSFDVENWNARIYGSDVVMPSLNNDGMIQLDMSKGQWIGEFGHPDDLSVRRQMTLLPERASHRILKYWQQGNLLKGHVRSLPYGNGLSMAANTLDNIPAAFSLRSLGSIDMQTRRVKKPLKIITYDYVYRPSHREAYQDKVLQENGTLVEPSQYELTQIFQESAVYHPLQESFNMGEIEQYAKERSENIKIIADMFRLDAFTGTLNENGTRMTVKANGITLDVPIESVINMQYSDVLSNLRKPKK